MKVPSPPPRYVTDPAPEEQGFRFRSGPNARSLEAFAQAIRTLPAETVHFHRDHYPAWLRHVLGDDPLALRFEHHAGAGAEASAYQDAVAALAAARVRELG